MTHLSSDFTARAQKSPKPAPLTRPRTRSVAAGMLVAATLWLSGCGGQTQAVLAPEVAALDVILQDYQIYPVRAAGSSSPILAMAGSWERCETGRKDLLTVTVQDQALGLLQLKDQRSEFYASDDCTGALLATADRVLTGTGSRLEVAMEWANSTFMSRDYVLPPATEGSDVTFVGVSYTAPAHSLRITGVTPTARTVDGQPGQCFARGAQEVCLPDVDSPAQTQKLHAAKLEKALDPDALYLFTMVKLRPPFVLDAWYRRVPV